MLDLFILLTGVASAVSGVFVLSRGDWKQLQLKYAGLTLSTIASIIFVLMLMTDSQFVICHEELNCQTRNLSQLATNIALIIFHLSTGRDAIRRREGERRRIDGATTCTRRAA